jgi:erythromycin esterase-like protein
MAAYVVQCTGAAKAIVWAHDDHVIKPALQGGYLLTGDYLNYMLGRQYYTIITSYTQGGTIRAFSKGMSIVKAKDPMTGQTIVKILHQKFGYSSGIAFSADLATISKYNAFMITAGREGSFNLEGVPWSSFDALAIVGPLQPTDLIP